MARRDGTVLRMVANGVTYDIQLRSPSWREIEARADAIVSDPSKRKRWDRRGLGGIEDPDGRTPAAPPERKYGLRRNKKCRR